MQMKPFYRALKWTVLFVGIAASLGACVVTEGNGDDDDDAFGGDGGSTSTAGTATTGGTTAGTAGTKTTGGGGSTSTAGTTAAGGEGGDATGYVPGVCDDDLAVPSHPADATLNADDSKPDFACRKCLKVSCKQPWSACFGDTPTAACGYGSTEDAPGQFECIRGCYLDDMSGDDTETVLSACEDKCLDQCKDKDQGFATNDTQDLLGCGQEKCLVECFTP